MDPHKIKTYENDYKFYLYKKLPFFLPVYQLLFLERLPFLHNTECVDILKGYWESPPGSYVASALVYNTLFDYYTKFRII